MPAEKSDATANAVASFCTQIRKPDITPPKNAPPVGTEHALRQG